MVIEKKTHRKGKKVGVPLDAKNVRMHQIAQDENQNTRCITIY